MYCHGDEFKYIPKVPKIHTYLVEQSCGILLHLIFSSSQTLSLTLSLMLTHQLLSFSLVTFHSPCFVVFYSHIS